MRAPVRVLVAMAAAVAAGALVATAVPAHAHAPSGDWAAPTPDPDAVVAKLQKIAGSATHNGTGGVDRVDLRLGPSSGQGGDALTTSRAGGGQESVAFEWSPTLACNGRYTLTATVTSGAGILHEAQAAELPIRTFHLAASPAVPGNLRVAVDKGTRAVYLGWDPNPERDVTGYQVERRLGDGSYQVVSTVPAEPRPSCGGERPKPPEAVVFAEVPTSGGEFSYRVVALRCDGLWEDGECNGVVASGKSSAVTAQVPAPPAAPPTTAAPGGSGGGSGGGAAPGSGSSEASRGVDLSRYGALRNQARSKSTTPTTADPGFGERLPFGEGDRLAEPGDGDSSEDEAAIGGRQIDFEGQGTDQRALLVPVAVALILLVIAMQLRWLMRVSTPLEAVAAGGPDDAVAGPPLPLAEHRGEEGEGTRLVEWFVPAAALRALDARRAARRAWALPDHAEGGLDVAAPGPEPQLGDAGASGVAVVDEDRRPPGLRGVRRRHAADVAAVADREQGQDPNPRVLRRVHRPGYSGWDDPGELE
jgi:hypothetical protein